MHALLYFFLFFWKTVPNTIMETYELGEAFAT